MRIDFVEKYINDMSEVSEEEHHENELMKDTSTDPIVIEIISSDEEGYVTKTSKSDRAPAVIFKISKITRTPVTESLVG